MKYFIAIIAFIAAIIFSYLVLTNRSWESLAALLGSIVVLLTAITSIYNTPKDKQNMQSIGNNSSGIQAGGNIYISNNKDKEL